MNTLLAIVIVVQVVAALVVIGLVLLQHGKGADMGAAFGSGASGSLFGASGSSNFLSRSTGIAAAVFFAATLALSFLGSRPIAAGGAGVMDQMPATPATPAKPQNATGQSQPAAPASGQSGEIPK
jgi:preprotein translocase subunit SecG